jgi:hypothetical protein
MLQPKASPEDITAFLASKGIVLNPSESAKLAEIYEEGEPRRNSPLGWLFSSFKTALQDESLLKGVCQCFKKKAAWEDRPVYGTFWDDHKLFDELSNYYGNQYRGSFVFNYLMGAMAVLAALAPVSLFAEVEHSLFFASLEFAIVLTVLTVHKIGASPDKHTRFRNVFGFKINRRWHERWIEYRTLAERFRFMEILYPIGINPLVEGPTRKGDLDSWVNAYYGTRISQENTSATHDLDTYKARLLYLIKDQESYHQKNAQRNERIHHRLHVFATWVFYFTLASCAIGFIWHGPILILTSGFLPAIAASSHGILASGEFVKLAQVSERMHSHIAGLAKEIEKTSDLQKIHHIAIEFHNIVIREALSWKSMFEHKNVPLA